MKFVFACFFVISFNVLGLELRDYSPYKFDVYFTNPICSTYHYDAPVAANDGSLLFAKPTNVYCKSADYELNNKRIDSPHYQILNLIKNPDVYEIFFTYLSFSEDAVAEAICDARVKRDIKVSFIMDSNNEVKPNSRKALNKIAECGATTYFRGNVKGLGFAHNKVIIAKFKSNPLKRQIVFSSANMSAGTTLHHENWNFVTTSSESYFAQIHACLETGMIDHLDSSKSFQAYMKSCRAEITTPEEDDIKVMFVPGEGNKAMKLLINEVKNSSKVDIAVHRFTHTDLIEALSEASLAKKPVRFISDDDIYWAGKRGRQTGANMKMEFFNVMKIARAGADIRYLETNQNSRYLHHNKFMLFHGESGLKLFTGAGNFTKAAFTKNLENYYFITIPEVTEIYRVQFEKLFYQMGTSWDKMPSEYINP